MKTTEELIRENQQLSKLFYSRLEEQLVTLKTFLNIAYSLGYPIEGNSYKSIQKVLSSYSKEGFEDRMPSSKVTLKSHNEKINFLLNFFNSNEQEIIRTFNEIRTQKSELNQGPTIQTNFESPIPSQPKDNESVEEFFVILYYDSINEYARNIYYSRLKIIGSEASLDLGTTKFNGIVTKNKIYTTVHMNTDFSEFIITFRNKWNFPIMPISTVSLSEERIVNSLGFISIKPVKLKDIVKETDMHPGYYIKAIMESMGVSGGNCRPFDVTEFRKSKSFELYNNMKSWFILNYHPEYENNYTYDHHLLIRRLPDTIILDCT